MRPKRRGVRARDCWLALLESSLVIPLGVVLATGSVVRATMCVAPDDGGRWAAGATIGAVVAFASMLLRRRRREALS